MTTNQPEQSNKTPDAAYALSEAMAEAVARASEGTVLVNARRRLPASGVGYSPELILTADHVIKREDDILVMLPNGTEAPARIAGRDPGSDLAVLRLEQAAAPSITPTASEPRVGQMVLALGRPSHTGVQASLGIVSSIGGPLRTGRGALLDAYLTTDAIPYPGFSGGPLIDLRGEVVGINTSGLTRGSSLTIPIQLAWQIADTLAQHGRVQYGYLGIRSQPVPLSPDIQAALGRDQYYGLLLVGIEEDSPAASGGLMIGDILVGIDNQPLADPDDLLIRLTGNLVGKPTPIEIVRAGQPQTVSVRIGERK
jgi:S1-C subfamily serine protease